VQYNYNYWCILLFVKLFNIYLIGRCEKGPGAPFKGCFRGIFDFKKKLVVHFDKIGCTTSFMTVLFRVRCWLSLQSWTLVYIYPCLLSPERGH